jgi:hypothetical protein
VEFLEFLNFCTVVAPKVGCEVCSWREEVDNMQCRIGSQLTFPLSPSGCPVQKHLILLLKNAKFLEFSSHISCQVIYMYHHNEYKQVATDVNMQSKELQPSRSTRPLASSALAELWMGKERR